jgi:hypothetical protein
MSKKLKLGPIWKILGISKRRGEYCQRKGNEVIKFFVDQGIGKTGEIILLLEHITKGMSKRETVAVCHIVTTSLLNRAIKRTNCE